MVDNVIYSGAADAKVLAHNLTVSRLYIGEPCFSERSDDKPQVYRWKVGLPALSFNMTKVIHSSRLKSIIGHCVANLQEPVTALSMKKYHSSSRRMPYFKRAF